jgi:membrane-associated phospholipid phosphatase
MVGYARLLDKRHWTSDVLAGAAIGTFVGKTVVHFNQNTGMFHCSPLLVPTFMVLKFPSPGEGG